MSYDSMVSPDMIRFEPSERDATRRGADETWGIFYIASKLRPGGCTGKIYC